jgi:peptide deformylase
MIAEILKMGHPLLTTRCNEVLEFNSSQLDRLIECLLDTREDSQGVGIAAPQVGMNQRVICFGGLSHRYPKAKSATLVTVLVNPCFEVLGDELIDGWEGCLSIPGLRGLVPRHYHIQYSGRNAAGELVAGEAKGFEARVIQHEVDHIEGVLFPQRLKDLTMFGYEEELEAIG